MDLVASARQQRPRPLGVGFAHVEECSNSLGPEEQSTDEGIGFHGVGYSGLGEQPLEFEGAPERAGDVNESDFNIVEILCRPAHVRGRVNGPRL